MAKTPSKVALINVHDYNRDQYSAYYEISVKGSDADGWHWRTRIYSRDQLAEADPDDWVNSPRRMNKVLEHAVDVCSTKDAADTAAQNWVKTHMEAYRRPVNKQAGFIFTGLMRWILSAFSPLFALSYSTTIRDNRLIQIINAIDGGSGAGLWRIYDGSRPATCGTATTLLAEITLSDPCGSVTTQVLTFDNTPALTDSSANATGTATWFRITDSTGTCCVDGNVGTSGAELNLTTTSITATQPVTVTSATITAGNA
jgi:hypothetical protein